MEDRKATQSQFLTPSEGRHVDVFVASELQQSSNMCVLHRKSQFGTPMFIDQKIYLLELGPFLLFNIGVMCVSRLFLSRTVLKPFAPRRALDISRCPGGRPRRSPMRSTECVKAYLDSEIVQALVQAIASFTNSTRLSYLPRILPGQSPNDEPVKRSHKDCIGDLPPS